MMNTHAETFLYLHYCKVISLREVMYLLSVVFSCLNSACKCRAIIFFGGVMRIDQSGGGLNLRLRSVMKTAKNIGQSTRATVC